MYSNEPNFISKLLTRFKLRYVTFSYTTRRRKEGGATKVMAFQLQGNLIENYWSESFPINAAEVLLIMLKTSIKKENLNLYMETYPPRLLEMGLSNPVNLTIPAWCKPYLIKPLEDFIKGETK